MSEDTETDDFSGLAYSLADQISHLNLIEADRTVDDARRYLWLLHFTGASQDQLKAEIKSEHLQEAVKIGELLAEAVTLMEAETVFFDVRSILWGRAFEHAPSSRYAHLHLVHDSDTKAH